MTTTLRLYADDDTRATVYTDGTLDTDRETDARGWDYPDGAVVDIDGASYSLDVSSVVATDDPRGDYVEAVAAPCAATLDDLLTSMLAGAEADWDSLPVFGGGEPHDTRGVWSWDETRLIAGTCGQDLQIVERAAQ